ncbi:MAG: hypothetical protein HY508_03195 [Acidobacteria bacterium]|nr:hypothetical protein [Acidobacteriota bacterium]
MKMEATPPPAAARPPQGVDAAASAPRPLIQEEWLPFVEEMLVAGLAVEDIAEAVIARGGPEISDGAILAHFRTHLDLQKRRVEQTVEGVAKLRQALGNPEADHTLVELANSALMAGYMGLTNKRAGSLTIKDAEVIRLSRENLKLRKRYMALKERGQARENRLLQSRLRYEDIKYDTAVERLKHLRKEFRSLMEAGKLEAGTLEKIREIYGIIKQPFNYENTETPAQG